jgi:hypothetical protein
VKALQPRQRLDEDGGLRQSMLVRGRGHVEYAEFSWT